MRIVAARASISAVEVGIAATGHSQRGAVASNKSSYYFRIIWVRNSDTVWAEIGFVADVERTNAEILPRILTAEDDRGGVITIKQYRGETIWL